MQAFQFRMPTNLIFGPGAIESLGEMVRPIGKKALVVTGRSSMRRLGILDRVEEQLKDAGIGYALYCEVPPNPDTAVVDRGAEMAVKEGCDFLIGLGGGSAIDAAKGIAVVAASGGSVWDYMEAGKEPGQVKEITSRTWPIVAIPTTSGTGTEATCYAVVTNEELKLKEGMGSPYLFPKVSIVDVELLTHMPPELTAVTGLDAFGQALEGYTSKDANMATDLLALEAMRRIASSLPRAFRNGDDLEARADVAWGATLSGMVISQVDANLCHAMSHPISAHYGTPHGLAVGLLTPATMEYKLEALPEKYAVVAEILGEDISGKTSKEAAPLAPRGMRRLMDELDIPKGLRDVGVREEDIPRLAHDTTLMGALTTNIRPAGQKELEQIFRKAM